MSALSSIVRQSNADLMQLHVHYSNYRTIIILPPNYARDVTVHESLRLDYSVQQII